jgi:hypothetical protein
VKLARPPGRCRALPIAQPAVWVDPNLATQAADVDALERAVEGLLGSPRHVLLATRVVDGSAESSETASETALLAQLVRDLAGHAYASMRRRRTAGLGWMWPFSKVEMFVK